MNRLLIVLILAGVAEAHSGNRLYPFYELTDEMLEQIDLYDGFIDEWYEIGEPCMTLLDFKTVRNFHPLRSHHPRIRSLCSGLPHTLAPGSRGR